MSRVWVKQSLDSNRSSQVLLVPLGGIPPALFAKYATILRRFSTISMSNLTAPGDWKRQSSPLKHFSWREGCFKFHFICGDTTDGGLSEWEDCQAYRRVVGVIGLVHLPSLPPTTDFAVVEAEFKAVVAPYRHATAHRILAFGHSFEHGNPTILDPQRDIVFPPEQEFDGGGSTTELHMGVTLFNLAVGLISGFENQIRQWLTAPNGATLATKVAAQMGGGSGRAGSFLALNGAATVGGKDGGMPPLCSPYDGEEDLTEPRRLKRRAARLRRWVADVCLLCGSPKDAIEHYRQALADIRATGGGGSGGDLLWYAGALEGYACCLVAMSDPEFPTMHVDPVLMKEIARDKSADVDKAAGQVTSSTWTYLTEGVVTERCGEALQLLSRSATLAPLEVELCFKLARFHARAAPPRHADALEYLLRALGVPDMGMQTQIERSIEAAIVCERAGLQRKAALFTHLAALQCSEFENWGTAHLLSRIAAEGYGVGCLEGDTESSNGGGGSGGRGAGGADGEGSGGAQNNDGVGARGGDGGGSSSSGCGAMTPPGGRPGKRHPAQPPREAQPQQRGWVVLRKHLLQNLLAFSMRCGDAASSARYCVALLHVTAALEEERSKAGLYLLTLPPPPSLSDRDGLSSSPRPLLMEALGNMPASTVPAAVVAAGGAAGSGSAAAAAADPRGFSWADRMGMIRRGSSIESRTPPGGAGCATAGSGHGATPGPTKATSMLGMVSGADESNGSSSGGTGGLNSSVFGSNHGTGTIMPGGGGGGIGGNLSPLNKMETLANELMGNGAAAALRRSRRIMLPKAMVRKKGRRHRERRPDDDPEDVDMATAVAHRAAVGRAEQFELLHDLASCAARLGRHGAAAIAAGGADPYTVVPVVREAEDAAGDGGGGSGSGGGASSSGASSGGASSGACSSTAPRAGPGVPRLDSARPVRLIGAAAPVAGAAAAAAGSADGSSVSGFYNPFEERRRAGAGAAAAAAAFWVVGEVAMVVARFSNPLAVELAVQSAVVMTTGARVLAFPVALVLPPHAAGIEAMLPVRPLEPGALTVVGVTVRAFNMQMRCGVDAAGRRLPSPSEIAEPWGYPYGGSAGGSGAGGDRSVTVAGPAAGSSGGGAGDKRSSAEGPAEGKKAREVEGEAPHCTVQVLPPLPRLVLGDGALRMVPALVPAGPALSAGAALLAPALVTALPGERRREELCLLSTGSTAIGHVEVWMRHCGGPRDKTQPRLLFSSAPGWAPEARGVGGSGGGGDGGSGGGGSGGGGSGDSSEGAGASASLPPALRPGATSLRGDDAAAIKCDVEALDAALHPWRDADGRLKLPPGARFSLSLSITAGIAAPPLAALGGSFRVTLPPPPLMLPGRKIAARAAAAVAASAVAAAASEAAAATADARSPTAELVVKCGVLVGQHCRHIKVPICMDVRPGLRVCGLRIVSVAESARESHAFVDAASAGAVAAAQEGRGGGGGAGGSRRGSYSAGYLRGGGGGGVSGGGGCSTDAVRCIVAVEVANDSGDAMFVWRRPDRLENEADEFACGEDDAGFAVVAPRATVANSGSDDATTGVAGWPPPVGVQWWEIPAYAKRTLALRVPRIWVNNAAAECGSEGDVDGVGGGGCPVLFPLLSARPPRRWEAALLRYLAALLELRWYAPGPTSGSGDSRSGSGDGSRTGILSIPLALLGNAPHDDGFSLPNAGGGPLSPPPASGAAASAGAAAGNVAISRAHQRGSSGGGGMGAAAAAAAAAAAGAAAAAAAWARAKARASTAAGPVKLPPSLRALLLPPCRLRCLPHRTARLTDCAGLEAFPLLSLGQGAGTAATASGTASVASTTSMVLGDKGSLEDVRGMWTARVGPCALVPVTMLVENRSSSATLCLQVEVMARPCLPGPDGNAAAAVAAANASGSAAAALDLGAYGVVPAPQEVAEDAHYGGGGGSGANGGGILWSGVLSKVLPPIPPGGAAAHTVVACLLEVGEYVIGFRCVDVGASRGGGGGDGGTAASAAAPAVAAAATMAGAAYGEQPPWWQEVWCAQPLIVVVSEEGIPESEGGGVRGQSSRSVEISRAFPRPPTLTAAALKMPPALDSDAASHGGGSGGGGGSSSVGAVDGGSMSTADGASEEGASAGASERNVSDNVGGPNDSPKSSASPSGLFHMRSGSGSSMRLPWSASGHGSPRSSSSTAPRGGEPTTPGGGGGGGGGGRKHGASKGVSGGFFGIHKRKDSM